MIPDLTSLVSLLHHDGAIPLTLHRTGQFTVRECAEDSTQCGFRRGDRVVYFDVTIVSSSVCLDDSGFILDNNEVQHYFDRTYESVEKFDSCERIALRAINDLREIMGRDRCFGISVEIKPGDYAGIKAQQVFHNHSLARVGT